ncbi:hypothetical protein DICVIV_10674 [Dictyocaulus viviparus]|uniref:Platelet-derived growth factor (PDGF) family profile domain-containing protein n=1 Tax=Dictyocaulus viviparus TaxID=29172 RepID=A0A0D8XHR9_DICVI|nr:hypothetical protein DICVIV_10674 [Dictyocaulus viviparus]
MFCSNPVWPGNCSISYRRNRMSDLGRTNVIEMIYIGNGRFMLNRTLNISMEEHTSCSCYDCGSNVPECPPGFVVGSDCTCQCANRNDRHNCQVCMERMCHHLTVMLHKTIQVGHSCGCASAKRSTGSGSRPKKTLSSRLLPYRCQSCGNRQWNPSECKCECESMTCSDDEVFDSDHCDCVYIRRRDKVSALSNNNAFGAVDVSTLPKLHVKRTPTE